jgi:hypothetical protein
LCAGAFMAWMINYCGARFLVFGKFRELATGLRSKARAKL